MEQKTRHILALSGGKDSSALAVYLMGKVPDIEYVFCDTEKELTETYDYLNRLESFLGKPIIRLKYTNGYGFDEVLKLKKGFLPSSEFRWCTEFLKLKPYEKYIGDDNVISYVGIRADEAGRSGYISTKHNIKTVFPFIENNICHDEVMQILESAGLGLPEYYSWRSRSGCFFCFFQQKREWVGLLEEHPDLFAKAMEYEKYVPGTDTPLFTWMPGESLAHLSQPERIAQIKADFEKRQARLARQFKKGQSLIDVWADELGDVDNQRSCLICHL